ncbi:MAG: M48 family metallopeptidase [Candidatus Sericytochromatia bacterium]|nr:M48 family metallopeptidase [Candidatus Tanganyikabacteria bacterium]
MVQPVLKALPRRALRLGGLRRSNSGREQALRRVRADSLRISETEVPLRQQLDTLIAKLLPPGDQRLGTVLQAVTRAKPALESRNFAHGDVESGVRAFRSLCDDIDKVVLPRISTAAEVAEARRFVQGGFFSAADNPPKSVAAARSILDRLNQHRIRRNLEYRPAVVNEPGIMAFGNGGDQVILSRGIVDDLPADEAAAIFAHEIAHLEQRHYTSLQIVGAVRRRLGSGLPPDLQKPFSTLANLATAGLQREQEFLADRGAARMLARAGISPGSLVAALERLRVAGPETISPLADHPPLSARIEILEGLAGQIGR